jgi:hypothetical protein
MDGREIGTTELAGRRFRFRDLAGTKALAVRIGKPAEERDYHT